jgi:VWFA-related protein
MALQSKSFWSSALSVLLGLLALSTVAVSTQAPAPAGAPSQAPAAAATSQPPAGTQQTPSFRVQVNLVTMDVTIKNSKGVFIDDLKRDEFEIFEDGVKQTLSSMTMVHGGRVTNMFAPPPPSPREGIILPAVRRANDTSGRIFLFFIDDLNIQFKNTVHARRIFEKISKTLLHQGDLLGIVSSGPSSIRVDFTYDIKRLERALEKIHGDGLSATDLIEQSLAGNEGPTELKYRAHVAFQTMFEALNNLEKVRDRRKSLVWVSEGYDYSPFQASRYGLLGPETAFTQQLGSMLENAAAQGLLRSDDPEARRDPIASVEPTTMRRNMMMDETFADADLFRDIAELTRAAVRANTVIYTIDPRGLIAGPDIDENVNPKEWGEYTRKTQDTMRMLAEETGGFAVVNSNDTDRGLKIIDNASSDYYVLGYVPSNPDPTHRRRKVEIKVTRKGAIDVFYRKEYLFRPATTPRRPVNPAAPGVVNDR